MDIASMTALELAGHIKKGALNCVQAVQAALDQIEKTDGAVGAYITVLGEDALKKAAGGAKGH